MTMRRGDSGPRVERLQKKLVRHGHDIAVDGLFGPQTERAVRAFQQSLNLVVDGIAGPRTLDALRGDLDARHLTEADLEDAAATLQVDLPSVHAVAEVESRGAGFLTDGRPQLLFERHIFRRRLEHHGVDPVPHATARPDLVNTRTGAYKGGVHEHARLAAASKIHPCAAIESASWGRFQIMGFHWESLGYAGAPDYRGAMETSEGHHLDAFVRFIKADQALHAALRERDWTTFARGYNGPSYAKNRYDERLAEAWQRHKEGARE
ncbi:MAG: N-acetylmuramidase family protein [Ectothiorhodospiraceae bacterium]|nr:N-acetylmuramidase family protein [Ectothiorhodospiraceae bacterium]